MHLMPDVETSLKTLPSSNLCSIKSPSPSPQALVDVVSTKTGVINFTARLGGCGLYHAIHELVSAKVNFMAILEIYGPRKLPATVDPQLSRPLWPSSRKTMLDK